MKIRTILLFALLFVIASFSLFSLSVLWAYRQIHTVQNANHTVDNLEYSISGLKQLTLEYMLSPGVRADEQWEKQVTETDILITSLLSRKSEDEDALRQMKVNLAQIKMIFRMLVTYEQSSAPAKAAAGTDVPARLAGQLMVRAQDIVSHAYALQTKYNRRLIAAQQTALWGIIIFASILVIVVGVSLHLFYRKIIIPLIALQQGTQRIGSGDLKHRIPVTGHDEIGDLTVSFNDMTAKLEAIDVMKSNFLMVAAHQLRTPLGIIRWSAEVLRGTPSPDDRDTMVSQIYSASVRMTAIVSELIDVTRIEQGAVINHPETIDVPGTLRLFAEELGPLFAKKQIQFHLDTPQTEPLTVSLDPRQFAITVRNLLTNAAAYTPKGGKVDASVAPVKSAVEIRITDTGIGIPPDDQPHIFSKFFRAGNAVHASTEGSGLGLYIAKSFARAWGGSLTFTSRLGKGTTFVLRIPQTKDAPAKNP